MSTFDLTPAPAPLNVTPHQRRVILGHGPLRVRFHARGLPGEVIGLRRVAPPHQLIRQVNTRGRRNAVVPVRTAHLRPGHYRVVLRDDATGKTEAAAPIWVYRPHSPARITTDRRVYRAGSPIRVSWTRAPGNNLDWVSLFRCHARCAGPGGYTIYRYTRTMVEGSLTLGRQNYLGYGSVRSLRPGQYVARVLTDDGYHSIGTSPRFRIVRR